MALSENDLKKSPVRFLVSGWEFYPDALLTPEEIQDSDHYMRYLSIGEMSNFSSPAAPSPYGCGCSFSRKMQNVFASFAKTYFKNRKRTF